MPESITDYKLFLASPSDCAKERRVVEEVVSDFNEKYIKTLKSHITLLSWEKSTYPDIGNYPQDVINREIGDYDIFVGILWGKFGSPTQKCDSGTEEEFLRALNQYRENNNSIHIMMYFNKTGLFLDDIDHEQVAKLQSFKANIKKYGCYYWDFTQDEFKELFSKHLYKVISEWGNNKQQTSIISQAINNNIDEKEASCEKGWLDYSVEFADKMSEAEKEMLAMVSSMEECTEKIYKHAEDIEAGQKNGADVYTQKGLFDQSAKTLNIFAKQMKESTCKSFKATNEGLEAVREILGFSGEYNCSVNDFNYLKNTLVELKTAMTSVIDPIRKYKKSVEETPRITQTIIAAKHNLTIQINNFEKETRTSIVNIDEVIQDIEDLIAIKTNH